MQKNILTLWLVMSNSMVYIFHFKSHSCPQVLPGLVECVTTLPSMSYKFIYFLFGC